MTSKKQKIVILGELPLVTEFAHVCHQHGFSPVCRVNTPSDQSLLPDFCRAKKTSFRNIIFGVELTNTDCIQKKKNLLSLEKIIPASIVIASSALTITVTEQAMWLRNRERLMGISALPTLLSQPLIEISPSVFTNTEAVLKAKHIFLSLGKESVVVQDRIGMVAPRMLCMIINEAFFAVQEDIASANDIDLAMKLGANYPHGPIEWAEKLSLRQIVAVLDALYADLREERYRVAHILRQLAITHS